MTKKTFTVLDVNESGISFLQGTGLKAAELITFGKTALLLDPQGYPMALAELLSKEKPSIRPELLCVSLPRRAFVMKNMILPTQNENELKKMISLQLPAVVAYKEDEIVWDYLWLEKTATGFTRILLLIISVETLKKYLEIFAGQKIYPALVTISTWGLVGWLKAFAHSRHLASASCQMLIRLETLFSEICFCDQERFYYSRQIEFGHEDLERGSAAHLLKQILLTHDSYRQERMGPLPESCLILSRDPIAKRLEEILRPELNLPIMIHDPLKEFPSSFRAKSFVVESLPASSYAVGLGLLTKEYKSLTNFLPTALKNSLDSRRRRLIQMKTALLSILALAMWVWVFSMPVLNKDKYLRQLQAQTERMSPAVEEAKSRLNQWGKWRRELSRRVPFADILDELTRLTPDGIFFNSLRLQPNGELTLQGQSGEGVNVNQLQNNLLNSPWFKNVTLQYATKRMTITGEVTQFLITVWLRTTTVKEE